MAVGANPPVEGPKVVPQPKALTRPRVSLTCVAVGVPALPRAALNTKAEGAPVPPWVPYASTVMREAELSGPVRCIMPPEFVTF